MYTIIVIIEKTQTHMFIQKKPKWHIFCRIDENAFNQPKGGIRLSFTMYDFLNFVPPNGAVTDFSLHVELGLNYSKIKTGIYKDPQASCIVTETISGIALHGISQDWEKLKELIAKIISSAGMEPKTLHTKDTPLYQILSDWTGTIQGMQKQ